LAGRGLRNAKSFGKLQGTNANQYINTRPPPSPEPQVFAVFDCHDNGIDTGKAFDRAVKKILDKG